MHINAATPALLLAALKPSLQGKHATIIASLSVLVSDLSLTMGMVAGIAIVLVKPRIICC